MAIVIHEYGYIINRDCEWEIMKAKGPVQAPLSPFRRKAGSHLPVGRKHTQSTPVT